MRFIVIAGLAGLSVAVASGGPAALWQLYQELYPADSAQRQALDECFAQDPRFERLDPAARQACYRHRLPGIVSAGAIIAPQSAANFVDLWRAAGQGNMPRNDVRFEEQNDRFIHPRGVPQR